MAVKSDSVSTARYGLAEVIDQSSFVVQNNKAMKKTGNNPHHPFTQTAMFAEGPKVNVRDRNQMQQLLISTQPVKPYLIQIEEWTPEDQDAVIAFQQATSIFGDILVASTPKGLCYLGFDFCNRISAFDDLKRRFPQNVLVKKASPFHEAAIALMNDPPLQLTLQLHLKGTVFQLGIWNKLAQIPLGGLTTYAQLGGSNKIARATGTAVGSNPITYLLPCHRVIQSNGSFNGYFWGTEIKEKLLDWEMNNQPLTAGPQVLD